MSPTLPARQHKKARSSSFFLCRQILSVQIGIELLQRKTAPGALHNSDERYDPPKCHPHTREAILQEIMDWIGDIDRQTRFLWLYGPAGAGKSAIEQTIAELCYEMNFLAASFFFSRSIGGRNEKTFLITTIVGQLIVSIPQIREHVGNALYNDPSLPTRSLEAQMDALVVKPLEAAASSSTGGVDFMNTRPKVIVLDGLDECGDPESQRYILKVLVNSVSNHSIPFSFIIASRPEQHIREAFDGKLLGSLTTRLVLDDKYHPDDDIRMFLQSKFQDIKDRHPSRGHLPSFWPSDKDVERLVQKSSGQFIYASTVIKFIDSHRHWPPDRLDIIFGISPRGKTTPFAELDSLYLHILTSASDNIETALEIFAILLFLHHQDLQIAPRRDLQITPQFVESFLSLREGEVFMILSDLHSIIAVPSAGEPNLPLWLFHASLGDFLTDHSRSGDTFFLDSGVCHRNIVNRTVKTLLMPTKPAASGIVKLLGKPIPGTRRLPFAYSLNRTEFYFMIALKDSEKQSLQAIFPEQCLKATPDPEFLSNLYEFDMSLCPHQPPAARTFFITQIFTETFDAINSSSSVPQLLVWMQGQVRRTIVMHLVCFHWHFFGNILIARMISLRTIYRLSISGFKQNYLRLKFITIPMPKSLSISLHPQRW